MKYDQYKKHLAKMSHEELEREVLNDRYNDFCRRFCDDELRAESCDGREKVIPYMGWFWRSVDFFNLSITVGKTGDFVGFMENNKWDHPERDLTEEEARTVIAFLDRAMDANNQGGQLSEIHKKVAKHLDGLKDFLTALDVPYIED